MFPVAVLVALVGLAAGLLNAHAGSRRGGAGSPPPITAAVTVSRHPAGPAVPAGFLGLSTEYWAVESYAGTDPTALDPVFLELVRNLSPGQSPVLRIGGDSTDWTWWPVPGMARPPGVTYTLGPDWVAVTRALTRALRAHLILGIDLEADSASLASTEARALLSGLGARSIIAFELGNEPTLYSTFPWYRTATGRGVPGRPAGYSFDDYLSDFTRIAAQLPPQPLAGPSLGGPGWFPYLGRFLAAAPAVRMVAVHRYPLQLCVTSRRSSRFPTIQNLLSPTSSTTFADQFAPAIATAHEHGLPLRIDELNSVSCGADRAVSQSFPSALWAADVLFELERVGADGVQMHTFPGAGYALFTLSRRGGRWSATVAPEYYGLLMFAEAAPPGSRPLALSGAVGGELKVWATDGRDGRLRVLVINQDLRRGAAVRLRAPGAGSGGTLERLLDSGGDVTLGGRSFGARTSTGVLSGSPQTTPVSADRGTFTIELPPASAALLTAPSRAG